MSNEAAQSNALTNKLRNFGENVSILGIPKILKANEDYLKIIWFLFFLSSAILMCWQLSLILIKYYNYPVSTTFGEDKLGSRVFPDISICSLYPLSLALNANLTLKDYLNQTNVDQNDPSKWKRISKYDATDAVYHNYVYYLLRTPNAYFFNFPKNGEPPKKCPALIVDCKIFDKTFNSVNITCSDYMRKFWDAFYYSCYTISLDSSTAENTGGISLAIYLDSDYQDYLVYNPMLPSSSPHGVRVSVHNRGTKPDFTRAVTAGVGTDTAIKITPTKRQRLSRPYNAYDCTDQKYLPYSSQDIYTYEACLDVCQQQIIATNCSCLFASFMHTTEQLDKYVVCGNRSCVPNGSNVSCNQDGIDNLACAVKIYYDKKPNNCDKICLRPCEEIIYDLSAVVSSWPHPAYELNIFYKYVNKCTKEDKQISDKFIPYTEALNKLFQTGEGAQAKNILKGNTLIKESFLQLSFIIEQDKLFILADTPAYTWDTMIGLVGGCLSLWLGMTVMTGIEVVEFFYIILNSCCNPKTKNNNADVAMAQVQNRP